MSDGDTVIFSDLHGRIAALEAVVDRYGDNVRYVSNGDAIDSPNHGDTKATIDTLLGIGAVCLYGNHEWVLSAALYSQDQVQKAAWTKVWARYQSSLLGSYGIHEPTNMPEYYNAAKKLRRCLRQTNHILFLEQLQPFYETEEMLVIHGGVTKDPWQKQRDFLKSITNGPLQNRQWQYEPDQIFDHKHQLSTTVKVPENIQKIFITGHTHTNKDFTKRLTANNTRVQLAGLTTQKAPLFVFQSWDARVVPISPNIHKVI